MDGYQGYQAPEAALEDVAGAGLELADRGARLAASILDGIFLGIPFGLGGVTAAIAFAGNGRPGTASLVILGLAGLAALAMTALNAVWIHQRGQTAGKRITGIKVLRANGERVTLLRVFFLRYLPLTLCTLIPWIGNLVALVDSLLVFRESRQCLHDQIADTIVVRA
ncbi:RDD family protein [Mesoterricola sediminis]|uniref:RDD domain-containing protein n=1 Tax=Mesoterricola sediminis TaxID=2927980 RepID=A0AA48GX45_9BACT|nr:RDD family protein [Mesoterricola sediminis]BDU77260.1 hypothetical protein METESE_22180 [Mesoterricola sediminis]